MNTELRVELERVGYDELYERHISGLSRPNARGERSARSPFPDSIDQNPSFYVNTQTGVWHCFSSQRGGNYLQFRAILEATEFDEDGRALPDYEETERRLLVEFGIANPIDPAWIAMCRDTLWGDKALQHQIQTFKPWNPQALYHLDVGYDAASDRFVIPTRSRTGDIVNARMYRPGGSPKILWRVPGFTGNFLFPYPAYRDLLVILCEGEGDAISLRSYGFNGASGTMGAGRPVPEGQWYRNKNVIIWMDDDEAGREATETAVRAIRPLATDVRLINWPQWEGKSEHADVSEYVKYLLDIGYSYEAVQRTIVELVNSARSVPSAHAVYDEQATAVDFSAAMTSEQVGRRISFTARIAAKGEQRYLLPLRYEITCPAGGHNYCRRCPMHNDFHGRGTFTHDSRSPETLKLIRSSHKEQLDAVKRTHGIIVNCPDPQLTMRMAADVEPVILTSPDVSVEGRINDDRSRREALIVLAGSAPLTENRDYQIEGFVYPDPKSQAGMFVVDQTMQVASVFDNFEMSDDLAHALTIFRPRGTQTVTSKLYHVAQDLIDCTTFIRARLDLHLAYRTVWHSIVEFDLGSARVNRGWIEAIVVGDTRCGKSATFRRMAEHYALGLLVDCKMQSAAGILGAVTTTSSGERFVIPGVLPQQDNRIVCFDEFHGARWENKHSIIDVLSSTRSEGVVRISKAASAQFRARVRAIWLANPGMGRLINEMGIHGIEIIARLIRQPEDIARFDFGLAVSQYDVSTELINALPRPGVTQYPQELQRALLAWTYTRAPDQVKFSPEAVEATTEISKRLYDEYDSGIPLVEPADQRVRVAKVAVSIAAQCFSTENGQDLQVTPDHVVAAYELFKLFYDKPVMGYNTYSLEMRSKRTVRDLTNLDELFTNIIGPVAPLVAEQLLELDEFTARTFATLLPSTVEIFPETMLRDLYANRCIRLVRHGKKESYELTPAFTEYLKRLASWE